MDAMNSRHKYYWTFALCFDARNDLFTHERYRLTRLMLSSCCIPCNQSPLAVLLLQLLSAPSSGAVVRLYYDDGGRSRQILICNAHPTKGEGKYSVFGALGASEPVRTVLSTLLNDYATDYYLYYYRNEAGRG